MVTVCKHVEALIQHFLRETEENNDNPQSEAKIRVWALPNTKQKPYKLEFKIC
jgi:hypothetical protein